MEAVDVCKKAGYAVTAIIVDNEGVRQAVLRGDGAVVHTLDSAYVKAYTAASLAPVRKDGSTKALSERIAKTPGVSTAGLASLPNVNFTPGGVTIMAGDEAIGGIGVGGAPGGNFDHDCAVAALGQDQGPDEVVGRKERSMHIGIAGIGNMGSSIGARLMEVGHKLTVWNRTAEKTKPLADAGAAVAKTPAELTSSVEVVISLLIDTAAIDAVYHGPQGLLAGDAKGKLFIEMSTVTPEAQIALAEKVRAKGAAFVECPVSGSVIPARAGKLLGLMGAEPADAARARPLLEQMCRRVMHAGPVGSGALLKLAVNLPLMIYWQALGEQLSMCKTLTIDPAELLDFLAETSGAATVLKQRMPGIVAKLKNVPSSQRTFSLDGGIKDVKQMLAEGEKRGLELPLLKQTLACYEEAKRTVGGNEEVSNVSAYWAGRAKS